MQFPQRQSPLASHWVAAGHYYDKHTGLVSPTPTPTPPSGGSSSTNTKDSCLEGVGEYERICSDGVKVVGRPSQPER
jgi:hypothetical protein